MPHLPFKTNLSFLTFFHKTFRESCTTTGLQALLLLMIYWGREEEMRRWNFVDKNIAIKYGHADFIFPYIPQNTKLGMDIAFIKEKCQFSLNIYVGILLFPFILPFISGRLIRCFMYLLNGYMRNIALITKIKFLQVWETWSLFHSSQWSNDKAKDKRWKEIVPRLCQYILL